MRLRHDFSPSIRNIFFDFGGVIMDVHLARTIEAFVKMGVSGLSVAQTQVGSGTFFEDHERGTLSSEKFLDALRTLIPDGARIPEEKIWEAWHALLDGFIPERVELLKVLAREKRYRIFVLSNTNPPHRKRFREMFREQFGEAFDDVFEKTFYSDELGAVKPEAAIYERAARAAGVVPAESLFIDDNPLNVAGARACGWQAYHLVVGRESILDLFEKD